MEKRKIAVLFGGCSPEYEISLRSAFSVITHISNAKCDPVLLGITQYGEWFCFSGDVKKIYDDTWKNAADCVRAIISPDRTTQGVLIFDSDNTYSIKLDAAMPVLHGKNGEDGTVQGLLELAGIPVVGCKTLASALCMDKDSAHKIAGTVGVSIPLSFIIKYGVAKAAYLEQAEKLGYPLFVKPVNAGSSYGITKVFSENELPAAVKLAFEYNNEIIIEQNVQGFEIGCAILGNDSLIVGMIDEIELTDGFFNHKEKYNLETSAIHVPARISEEKAAEAKETAKTIYKALGCTGFARVDMFLTPSGEIVFNEVNTIPGFTTHSRYPNMLKALGMTLEQVIDMAIELAVRK
jgi:D-alanine---D-serine ligase